MRFQGAFTCPEVRAHFARWTLVVALPLLATTTATAGVLIRVFPETLPDGSASRPLVHQIARIDNEIWIVADGGVYRVVGQQPKSVLSTVSARIAVQVDDMTLVGGADGVRVRRGTDDWIRLSFPALPADASRRCQRYSQLDIPVVALVERDGIAWLGTECGLARWDGNAIEWFDNTSVLALRRVGQDIWVGGSGTLYRIDETDGTEQIDVGSSRIERIDHAAGAVWGVASSGRPGGLYDRLLRVVGDRASPVEGEGFRFVYRVVSIRGDGGMGATAQPGLADRAWLATNTGVFEYTPSGTRPIAVQKLGEAVNTIAEWNDLAGRRITWVGSTERAYRQVDDEAPEILPTQHPLTRRHEISVKEIVFAGGAGWLRTDEEVFRYDEGVSLFVQPKTVPFAGVQLLFGRTLSIAEYGYRDETGADPYSGAVSGDVHLAAHWERPQYEAALLSLSPARDFERQLPVGIRTLWYRARDEFGNVTDERRSGIWVIPWVLLAPVGWLLLAVLLIVLASQIRLVMRWLQYKQVRTGMWFVLSWRCMQRLLLTRYRHQLAYPTKRPAKRGFRFADLATGQQMTWSEVAARLGEQGLLRLVFPSPLPAGECLSAFSRHLLRDPSSRRSVGRAVPIVVEVRGNERSGTQLEEAALAELGAKGGVTDLAFAKEILSAGGFIFLLNADGRLGGIEAQNAVHDFVSRYGSPGNFLVLGIGTQEKTELLASAPAIEVYAVGGDSGAAWASESAPPPGEAD